MSRLTIGATFTFRELPEVARHPEVEAALVRCVEAQRRAAAPQLDRIFKPNPESQRAVSPEALEETLAMNQPVNGIRTEREISNVIVFNNAHYADAVLDEAVKKARADLDAVMQRQVRRLFVEGGALRVTGSGFFLYPPGEYMGWHTNWQNPGWRLYLSYADEPGRSFFRYRDPRTGKIVTSMDSRVNVRLFNVCPDTPFWHAVHSDTHRFSMGYKVVPQPPLAARIGAKLRGMFPR
jgi:hypothetical protein